MRRIAALCLALLLLVLGSGVAVLYHLGTREEFVAGEPLGATGDAAIARGAYLVRLGDCAACHTARGGLAFAGQRPISTPFGTVYSTNLTPDPRTGLGNWTADDLWRALHNGLSRDGHFLYPAFPFPNYTKITRADSDAIFAYLRSLAPIELASRPAELRFPYNLRPLLAVWRALYFRAATWQPSAERSAQWNRGAYLAEGLGHCNACHANRNLLGATDPEGRLSGAQIPIVGWYAPSLIGSSEAGLLDWPTADLVTLLGQGTSARATVFGPMAEVVQESLQYFSPADLAALVVYLKDEAAPAGTSEQPSSPRAVPPRAAASRLSPADPANPAGAAAEERGWRIYEDSCEDCHGADGQGVPGVYPPLAANRAILTDAPVNPIRVVLLGGFGPVTAGNPRPYGMPPFAQELVDADIAAVVSSIRSRWGNHARAVEPIEVDRLRAAPAD